MAVRSLLLAVIVLHGCVCQRAAAQDSEASFTTADPLCTVAESARRDCGQLGITQQQCENKGCCWKPASNQIPWCFHPQEDSRLPGEDAGKDGEDPALAITSILIEPYLMLLETTEGTSESEQRYKGYIPDLLDALCTRDFITCSYEVVLVRDGLFGSRDTSGTWNGMIGEVASNSVDFAAAPLSISPERRVAVNFTEPFADVSLTLVANTEDNVESLESLVNRSDLVFGTISGGATMHALAHERSQPYSKLWTIMQSRDDSFAKSTEDGLDRASRGGYVFIMEDFGLEFFLRRWCALESVAKFLPREGYGLAFPFGSDIKARVDEGIDELKNDGTLDSLREKWFETGECNTATWPFSNLAIVLISAVLAARVV